MQNLTLKLLARHGSITKAPRKERKVLNGSRIPLVLKISVKDAEFEAMDRIFLLISIKLAPHF